ncbi:gp58-like family protein [Leuconostoc citreum]|uniref:gp58-like family protein n=1 Tax=Leuconostoc citreum TaxID=33964 RepID=UPI0021820EEA|nr:gp58-like family protein [Leuconostoc citreum]
MTTPINTAYVAVVVGTTGSLGNTSYSQPMLVFASKFGTYVQGNYNNNAALAQVKITADSISSIVSNPTTGLSTRVQTAEGALSKVKGTDIPALQNATFWQPYSSLNFNDYTKQGSFFFNTTAAKTNGPTTSNGWLYLIVEQGTADNSRIKQTAWYDGVAGVKITYVRTLNSGTWSPWYANDNDSVTTISQTNSNVTQEISDRKTGDKNTLQQGKDFTTSQISNSETGMTSFVNQTISGLQIGVIKDDVSSLKSQVNWQQVTFDDMNYLNTTGNYLITGGKGTNSPFTPWFYITVDAPRTDRITQTVWKDSNSNLTYTRSLFETTWSAWHQVVSSETLLSIFHDSWSLGTSTNDGITKQMITGIMGQPDGTLILKGNSLILDGNTTVTGDFYAKGGNFTNLNASNITVGTLNGNTVNITNINASNIVTGAISGANLNINLNTGQVVFQKGRIYNEGVQTSGAGIDVNIDQRYIATSDGYSSSVLKNGMMMLYQSTLVNSGKDPYFQIDNFGTQLTFEGARLRGSKNISLGVYSSSDVPVFGGHSELNGAVFSDGYAARIEGKDKGVKVSGGAAFGSISPASPNILVGVDSLRSGFGGDRIAVNAKYFYLLNQYATTTSSGANMFLTDDGAVIRSSSSSKYKLNINYEQSSETANRLLTIDPALWHDKFESEQLDKFHDIGIEPERTIDMDKRWYYGIIAEDLVKAGLEHLVMRDTKTGEVEGVEYSKIGVALIPIIRELRNRLNEQYVEIERLKEKSK